MPDIPSQRNMKRTGGRGGVSGGDPNIADHDVSEAREAAMENQFGYLSPSTRKDLGISSDEKTYAIRNPEFWQARGEGSNRWLTFQREKGNVRLVEDKEGRNVLDGTDNLLVAYPAAADEARDAAMRAKLDEDQQSLVEVQDGPDVFLESDSENWLGNPEVEFTREDRRMLQELKEMNRRAYRSNGMMGGHSRTAGMKLAEAESMYTDEQIEAEERNYSRRTSHSPITSEEWQNFIRTAPSEERTQRGKQFGASGSGFPGTTPTAVRTQERRRATAQA